MPTFIPPAIHEGIPGARGLWRFYRMPRGVSVAIVAGEATTIRYPDQNDFDTAEALFLGGHEYDITDEQATVLTAAGFGDYIT